MATIRKEIKITRGGDFVWEAIRDVSNIHKRLVPEELQETAEELRIFFRDE